MECTDFRKWLISFYLIMSLIAYSFALTQFWPFSPMITGKYGSDDDSSYLTQDENDSPAFFNELLSPFQRNLRSNKEPVNSQPPFGTSEDIGKAKYAPLERPSPSPYKKHKANKDSKDPRMNRSDYKKSDKKKKTEALKEISWRDCSAKNVKVHLDSNVNLRCEFWAPIGSNVTWFKDERRLRDHPGNITFINPAQPSNDVIQDTDVDNIGRKTYEFHLKTLYPLDCVTAEDEGKYKLQITTPEGRDYIRTFNVKTIGISRRYSIMYCKYFNVYSTQFDPRIVLFSKTIVGKIGEELILPCRPKEYQSIAINWYNVDRKITPDNYNITLDGDLQIKELSLDDMGMFVCEVFNVDNEITYDQITTFVKVRD